MGGIWREENDDRWIAEWGDSSVRTYRPHPGRVVVWRCAVDDGDDLGPVVANIVAFAASAENGLIVTWESPDRVRINAELRAAGCTVHREKLFVQRELAEDLPPAGDFAWRTLAEAGEAEILPALVSASEGDPFEEEPRDPEREWKELVEDTGDDLDPTLWRVALQDGEPVGVVLPTVWKGRRREGTLSYVGVVPAHRGRGLGRALHAAGLHLLAGAGALRYAGSTDVRNTAMARVFERNGCPTTSVQLLLHPPRAG
jgi:RimJ/RimL family protein N-acetyltransferase